MKQNQQKKVALVTGASSGMGKEIAKQLMTDGYRVYAAARQVDQMNDLAELGVLPVRLDISEPNEIESLASTILGEVGRIDVLVNNAGFGLYGAVEDVGIEEARHQFEVNLFGLARLTQLLLPAMREKKSGNIVNISSMGGKVYTPLRAWYHATKHALEGWSDCLRLELAPFGIRVVIIEPGLIETGFGEVLAGRLLKRSGTGAYVKMTEAVAQSTRAAYGQGRATDPKVIASLVCAAVRVRRPKTRYVAGKYAKPMILIRKWLGDRMFDRIITSQMQ